MQTPSRLTLDKGKGSLRCKTLLYHVKQMTTPALSVLLHEVRSLIPTELRTTQQQAEVKTLNRVELLILAAIAQDRREHDLRREALEQLTISETQPSI